MAASSYFGAYTDCLSIVGAVGVCIVALAVGRLILGVAWKILCRQFCVKNFKEYGRWAVVTGCTEGIGKSYALQLAEKGMDMVLISRNPQKLSAVAQQIANQYKVSVKVVAADFKRTDIYDNIKQQLKGLDIGVLVNNVGMMDSRNPCYFCESEDLEQYIRDIVNVNVLACVMMTGIVLPDMLERKRGAIITLSSSGGLLPLPFFSLYCGTKAFLRYFSEALNLEYASHGVTIQVVTPSLVQSNLSKRIAQVGAVEHGLLYPDSDTYVSAALKTVGLESCTVAYWPHELQLVVFQSLPASLLRHIVLEQRNKMMEDLKAD